MTIYTIGHSTRSFEDFVALLRAHHVHQIADVRAFPRSRRHPHFNLESLERALPTCGVGYRHFRGLGGRRQPRRHSPNSAWRSEGFRGYADYMITAEFVENLDALVDYAAQPTAVMCAEAVWWRCHRQLIADALVARDVDVRHIGSAGPPAVHTLTPFARLQRGKVTYPGLVDGA